MAKFSDQVVKETQLLNKKQKSHEVAVIIHLHYGDLFDVIARYLDNISADLYFSVRDGCFTEMSATIAKRYPDAVVVSYPNHGRDVVPFLRIFRHIEPFGYKAICKIHSKKSKHRADGDQWRDDVFNKLLGDRNAISSCLAMIDSGAGVVAPAGHLLAGSNYWGSNAKRVTELALRMGCPEGWVDDFEFPAGTMFWFKPEALNPLMRLDLSPEDFETEAGQVDGTTAHAVERLIGLSAMRSGFEIKQTVDEVVSSESEYAFAAKTVDGRIFN
jgi:lipopolysaccharide biosynthesis protein